MKNIFIVLAIAILSNGSIAAQKIKTGEVPANVLSAFHIKFPAATDVRWEKEGATEYEAGFKTGTTEQFVKYDKYAKWLETETEIESSALPAAVAQSLRTLYKDYKVKETEKVDIRETGIVYEIEISKGKETSEVRMAPDGKVISTEKAAKD